mmetsp:Transcript_19358/g.18697  ORF Transcript_19358/g.18697 Transcript_19358/m.18697 type:complete len:120 (+) Transcript_19358:257-616(+)
MNGIFNRGFGNAKRRVFNAFKMRARKFSGGGHNSNEPSVPILHDRMGKGLLIFMYLWVFSSIRANKGQLVGLYEPWLHPHEHEEHVHFEHAGDHGDNMPTSPEEEEHEHESEDHEEEEE